MSQKVGALWLIESEKKTKYLAGYIDLGIHGQARVVVFKNELKDKDNHPDYHILLSENNDDKRAASNDDAAFV